MVVVWLAQLAHCRVPKAVPRFISAALCFSLHEEHGAFSASSLLVSCLQAVLSLLQEDLAERLASILHNLEPEVRCKLLHVAHEVQVALATLQQSNLSWLETRHKQWLHMHCHVAASHTSSQPAAPS